MTKTTSAGAPPRGRPVTLPSPWKELAETMGGVQAVADALASSPRTVRQWAHGERTPRGPSRVLVDRLFRRHKIQVPE